MSEFANKNLIKAAKNGNCDDLKLALNAGADINFVDEEGYSALLHAAYEGHFMVAEALILRGCDVKKEDRDGYDAKIWAENYGDAVRASELTDDKKKEYERISQLLQRRSNIPHHNAFIKSELLYLCHSPNSSVDDVRSLIELMKELKLDVNDVISNYKCEFEVNLEEVSRYREDVVSLGRPRAVTFGPLQAAASNYKSEIVEELFKHIEKDHFFIFNKPEALLSPVLHNKEGSNDPVKKHAILKLIGDNGGFGRISQDDFILNKLSLRDDNLAALRMIITHENPMIITSPNWPLLFMQNPNMIDLMFKFGKKPNGQRLHPDDYCSMTPINPSTNYDSQVSWVSHMIRAVSEEYKIQQIIDIFCKHGADLGKGHKECYDISGANGSLIVDTISNLDMYGNTSLSAFGVYRIENPFGILFNMVRDERKEERLRVELHAIKHMVTVLLRPTSETEVPSEFFDKTRNRNISLNSTESLIEIFKGLFSGEVIAPKNRARNLLTVNPLTDIIAEQLEQLEQDEQDEQPRLLYAGSFREVLRAKFTNDEIAILNTPYKESLKHSLLEHLLLRGIIDKMPEPDVPMEQFLREKLPEAFVENATASSIDASHSSEVTR
jgi:hypothetical protein